MTHRVIFSPRAEAQLVKLHKDISDRSAPAIGERYATAYTNIVLASRLSHIGEHGATIAFEVEADTVVIHGVYYGGQDYDADLRDADDPNTEWVPHQVVKQGMARQRAELLARIEGERGC